MPLSQSTWHPTLHPGYPVGSITYGHTEATSAGGWVKWLERAEVGRGEATYKPRVIWRGQIAGVLGLSALPGSPGSESCCRWFPWLWVYVDAVSGKALVAFSGKVQSCTPRSLIVTPPAQVASPQKQFPVVFSGGGGHCDPYSQD